MRSSLRVVLSASVLSLAVAACGGNKNEKVVDYKTPGADANRRSTLELPPDLISPVRDDRYVVPSANTASAAAASQVTAGAVVAPLASTAASKFRIERVGNQRWIVAQVSADAVWPQLREFWKDLGFVLVKDDPVLGIMETEWAENRAKIVGDPVQRALSMVLGTLVSNGERDRYRTRIEPAAQPGMLEIYVSHRAAEEMRYRDRDGTYWELRPANPELEAEMLQRIMVRLGQDEKVAKQLVSDSKAPVAERARLVPAADGNQQLVMQDTMDRGWRQVGLALDRIGVVVEDRDRAKGIYYVRYVASEDLEGPKQDKGWFSGWFGSKKPAPGTDQFRVLVSAAGDQVQVQLLDKDGNKAAVESSRQIMSLLHKELK